MKTPSYDSQARLLWGDKPPVVATDAPFASASRIMVVATRISSNYYLFPG